MAALEGLCVRLSWAREPTGRRFLMLRARVQQIDARIARSTSLQPSARVGDVRLRGARAGLPRRAPRGHVSVTGGLSAEGRGSAA